MRTRDILRLCIYYYVCLNYVPTFKINR
ncbi:hypothetical protein ACFW04_006133 [Cataglyphis niger]